MNQRIAHATAAVCLLLLATLSFGVRTPDGALRWDEIEYARWSQRLEHSEPGSWQADKAAGKLARLDELGNGGPAQGHPDEYMRYLEGIKTPSDRSAPEYLPGYQMRELAEARLARRATAEILPWVNRGPGNVAGRARAMVIDPADPTGDTWLIAAVGGGIWKTADQGVNWIELTADVAVTQMQSLAISPADPLTIYAGTGESYWNIDTLGGNGIFKSVNGGTTWTQLASTLDDYRFSNISRIIVDPADENLLVVSTTVWLWQFSLQPTSHIFRSVDGGANWTEVYQEVVTEDVARPRIQQLVADPTNFDVQYATSYGLGIYKSTDRGLTWNPINNGITDFTGRFELAVSPINTDYLFVSAMGDDAGNSVSRLWHSVDGGANWVGGTEIESSSSWLGRQGWYDNTIICSPDNSSVVYVGGVRLWKITVSSLGSTGYGISQMSTGPVHVDHHGLQIVEPSGGGWYILNTNDGGVGVSSSGDTGWSKPTDGLTTTQFYGVDKRPGKSAYVGGMQDNGTWRSPVDSDRLDAWTFQVGGDGYETSWHFNDPSKIIGGYQYNGLARSLDGGQTWFTATSGLSDTGSEFAPFLTKIGKSNARPDQLFAVGTSGPWRSDDFGGSWNLMTLNGGNWGWASWIDVRVSEADPDVVWAGSRMDGTGDIFVSTDAGTTFDPVVQYGLVTMGFITGMAAHPTEPGTAFLLFSFAQRPKLLKTTDYGQTWNDISGFGTGTTSTNGFPDVAIYDLVVFPNDPNRIWVGSEIGLIESIDGGATWALADNGFPSVGIWYLVIEEDEVVVASHGRGIWSVNIPELDDGQFFAPLLEGLGQGPGGDLTLDGSLRSAADMTEVIIDGLVVETLGPNTPYEDIVRSYPVLADGTRTALLRSYKDGVPHDSISKTINVLLLADPVPNYSNDLTTADDLLIQGGFSIEQPAGFSDPALHSTHNYPDGQTLIAILRQPIIIGNTTTLSFDEIAIVEPGENGVPFPQQEFWDYVIVDGSLDGVNWVPVLDGYDCRTDATWNSAYFSGTPGNSSMYRNRQILLNDTFNLRDEILLRFRLFADASVTGWGWVIDNINVVSPFPTASPQARRFALSQNTPNPFNPQTEINFELPQAAVVKLQIFDLRGRLVKTLVDGQRQAGPQSIVWNGRDARGAKVASGVYLYQLQSGEQVERRKMTLVK